MSDMPDKIWAGWREQRGEPDNWSGWDDGRTEYIRADLTGLRRFYNYEGELPDKFIALYSDGSGCTLFAKRETGYFDANIGELVDFDKNWFTDVGYLWFIALPDDFKVWGED